MKTTNKYVGLDVHKDTIMIAVADVGREGVGAESYWMRAKGS